MHLNFFWFRHIVVNLCRINDNDNVTINTDTKYYSYRNNFAMSYLNYETVDFS